MGLFQKTPKITTETKTSQCPHCGKQHRVEVCTWAQYYLDGSPAMSAEQYYSRFVICDKCGYIFNVLNNWSTLSDYGKQCAQKLQSMEPQTYASEVEKKRALLRIVYPNETLSWIDVKIAQQCGDTAQMLQLMAQLVDTPRPFASNMGNDCFYAFTLPGQFFFKPEYMKLDYLRRLGRFDEAKQLIQELQESPKTKNNPGLQLLLDTQSKLIRKKDITQH